MTDLNALRYTDEHEWIAADGDTVTIGITDYAADKLGDVVFVELPAVGTEVTAGSVVGEVRSAHMGVLQVVAPNSTDTSGEGMYDTGTIDKDVTAVVNLVFEIGAR